MTLPVSTAHFKALLPRSLDYLGIRPTVWASACLWAQAAAAPRRVWGEWLQSSQAGWQGPGVEDGPRCAQALPRGPRHSIKCALWAPAGAGVKARILMSKWRGKRTLLASNQEQTGFSCRTNVHDPGKFLVRREAWENRDSFSETHRLIFPHVEILKKICSTSLCPLSVSFRVGTEISPPVPLSPNTTPWFTEEE